MARPTQNRSDGEWSLTQVSKNAAITMRTARTLVDGAWLPSGALRHEHVVIAKVAAALMDAPRPEGEGRGPMTPTTEARYRALLDKVYVFLNDPIPSSLILVSPTEATIVNTMNKAAVVMESGPPQPTLLLPLGAWVQGLLP